MASWTRGTALGDNPWSASGLEWATASPPPSYNFVHTPVVESLHPLWDIGTDLPVVTGLRTDRREMLLTTTVDARPDLRHAGPFGLDMAAGISPSAWDYCSIGSIFSPYYVPACVVVMLPGLFGWGWQSTRATSGERIALPGATVVDQS